jgi:hypothetical protein
MSLLGNLRELMGDLPVDGATCPPPETLGGERWRGASTQDACSAITSPPTVIRHGRSIGRPEQPRETNDQSRPDVPVWRG